MLDYSSIKLQLRKLTINYTIIVKHFGDKQNFNNKKFRLKSRQ